MPNTQVFVDVVVPLSLPQLYTYSVPQHFSDMLKIGQRAIVQFGKRKFYTALVRKIHNNKPGYEVKEISDIVDDKPIVNEIQFRFWEWIASYYMCTPGEVYKAAIPAAMKLESQTKIALHSTPPDLSDLKPHEYTIYQTLKQNKALTLKEVGDLIDRKNPISAVKRLIDLEIVSIDEQVKQNYKPKTESYIKLTDDYYKEEKLHQAFNELTRAPKQLQLLMAFIEMSDHFNEDNLKEIKKTDLLKRSKISSSICNALVDRNIFEIYEKQISRLDDYDKPVQESEALTNEQQSALNEITELFKQKDTVLLHGVTASGKTEVYIQLIKMYLEQGKQVLYLLPEIAITAQIVKRLQKIFGDKTGVYHSKFNDAERVEIWNNIDSTNRNSEREVPYQIILGVRSSVFLPFDNLGLIIVDEEHENTYKQYNPAPRYHARDAAIVLAKMHNAKTLLGTATPCIETYTNTETGKFGLVELKKRYSNIQLPETIVVDMKAVRRKKQMKSHFTPLLLEYITRALENKEQVLLFQNRRGFSPYLECKTCGWIPKCENCDVSLTYHKFTRQLVCHYCSYTISTPPNCLACGDTAMQTKGFGTEKIEDELPVFFPDARIARMDLDSTRSKKSYLRIIDDFDNQNIDILIGTQMISKGLDFANVRVVGILNADNMLNYPDFRSYERSYQLMAQVSGRAGRKNKRGMVIIQTSDPKNYVIQDVIENNFDHLFNMQIAERRKFNYPPFCRLILITLKHKSKEHLEKAANEFAKDLYYIFRDRMLGPEYPPVMRIQNKYQQCILLKIEKSKSVEKAKKLLSNAINRLKSKSVSAGIFISINVDPY